jgi:hypothetical protein
LTAYENLFVLFVSFGTPGQAWPIYLTERSQTCELLVQHVAAASCAG